MAKKTAVVLLAAEVEEIDFAIATAVLRWAEFDVIVAGVAGKEPVKGMMQINLVPDDSLTEVMKRGPYDIIVLPGGIGGSRNLAASADVGKFLKEQEKNCRYIAAVCAAPTALKAHRIGLGKRLTSHPAMKDEMLEGNLYTYLEERVVVDGKLITGRGFLLTFDFALKIVEILLGKEAEERVAEIVLMNHK